jgi:hypothetical protein
MANPQAGSRASAAWFKPGGRPADIPLDIDMSGKLNITYSAYRELELVPQSPMRAIGEAIIALADDPRPPGSTALQGIGGCHYVAIDDYYILYHIDEDDGLTVLGVLQGPYHPLH